MCTSDIFTIKFFRFRAGVIGEAHIVVVTVFRMLSILLFRPPPKEQIAY